MLIDFAGTKCQNGLIDFFCDSVRSAASGRGPAVESGRQQSAMCRRLQIERNETQLRCPRDRKDPVSRSALHHSPPLPAVDHRDCMTGRLSLHLTVTPESESETEQTRPMIDRESGDPGRPGQTQSTEYSDPWHQHKLPPGKRCFLTTRFRHCWHSITSTYHFFSGDRASSRSPMEPKQIVIIPD